jgi:hemoglobin-like flavoprotein
MWEIVNKKFVSHIEAAGSHVGVIERSWKYIEEQFDLEDISDIFFKYFFHEAPVLQAYFVKPTKMQRVMFEKAMHLIVKSVRDTAVLNIDLKGIAMRHIKYDITSEHLRIFGDVLMTVLHDTAGDDHWDEEVKLRPADFPNSLNSLSPSSAR